MISPLLGTNADNLPDDDAAVNPDRSAGPEFTDDPEQGADTDSDRRYFLLYKPVKHLTQLLDTDELPGLGRYVPPGLPRLFCVGRLDVNTEGALLLTNDGLLARRVLDPTVGLEKTYHVKVRDHLRDDDPGFERIRRGLRHAGITYRPARVAIREYRTRATWIEIVLTEGKFREIRNMCAVNRWQIVKLRRVAIGPVGLGDLTPRRIRELDEDELRALRTAVGLDADSGSALADAAMARRDDHRGAGDDEQHAEQPVERRQLPEEEGAP